MKEDRVTKLSFDDDFLLDSAQKRFEEGNYFGALTVLNKREMRNDPIADAYEIYADIYEALELWPLAVDSWFRFLDTCAREEFSEGYEGLAIAYMNMGNELQSGYYYRRSLFDEDMPAVQESAEPRMFGSQLRLIHDADAPVENPELLAEGLALLKAGDLTGAREAFGEIPPESNDFPSGAGLSAMCTLMLGEEEAAEKECESLIASHPDNVQILTTYCAVLGAREKREEAKEVARRLAALPNEGADDLYRIATALCETGLHAEAYEKLTLLKKRLPFDENILWFHAVAAYRMLSREEHEAEGWKHLDEAIESLETLTTLHPRKAVALWYLARLRTMRDGGNEVPMSYYYRLPEAEYRRVASFLLNASGCEEGAEFEAIKEEFSDCFRLAFDEMEGHDEKLQMLAAKVAVKCRADNLIRAALLDCNGDEIVKLGILHDLVCRNEENSFGAVMLHLYREIFTHTLDIGRKKADVFLQAFADVYSKYALLGEDCENRLCAAGEDIYNALAEAGEWELLAERASVAAAIYREARLKHGERSLKEICNLFGAELITTEHILDYLM